MSHPTDDLPTVREPGTRFSPEQPEEFVPPIGCLLTFFVLGLAALVGLAALCFKGPA